MNEIRPRASDYLWALLAAAAGIAAALSVFDLINAFAALASSELDAWHRIGAPLLAVGYLAALLWVSLGAWRRTVWGCRLPPTTDGVCPRHGSRCAHVGHSAGRP
ncbi:MAG: hypothetical protein M3N32_04315 [Actinomycetota bacterium]|nr:hypothetical protein [Actinomycetota bacterium]